jgi:myo-inositol-1(or 4)-monophosphatase
MMSEADSPISELDYVVELARRVGEVQLDYFDENSDKAREPQLKSDASLVTQADLVSDRMIHDALAIRFPDDAIISEELAPGVDFTGENTWVVDPLDGTTNFSLGLPFWGVSIARVRNGMPCLAVLYFPMLRELYTAIAGEGAFLNGKPTRVATPDEHHGVGFLTCCSRTHRRYIVGLPLKTRILGAAAYSLCAVAKGTAAVALETIPKLWDIAAASLVVTEAGGLVEGFGSDGPFPLELGQAYSDLNYPTLAAASPELLKAAHETILPR